MSSSATHARSTAPRAHAPLREGPHLPPLPFTPLIARVLLAINIPLVVHDGVTYTDGLWAHDLARHLDYLPQLTLFCPVHEGAPPPGHVPLDFEGRFKGLQVRPAPPSANTAQSLARAGRTMRAAWAAAKDADIVQGSPIGWPLPLGYFTYVAARLQKRFHFTVFESAPWKPLPGERHTPRHGLMAWAARRIARGSDLTMLTSHDQMRDLLGGHAPHAHIFRAAWIERSRVLDTATVLARRVARAGMPLVVGFAARLVAAKGLDVLLQAMHLIPDHVPVQVRVIGEGEGEALVRAFVPRAGSAVRLHFEPQLAYGDAFFKELDRWDIACVPSLSSEQPRIIFDAFARGLPVLVSDMPALLECVDEGVTGYAVPRGDAPALAQAITGLAMDPVRIDICVSAVLQRAAQQTHEHMHADRCQLLTQAWNRWREARDG